MEEMIQELTEADKAFNSFYRIHLTRMDEFTKKIERLNKRAAKMKCPPIVVENLGEYARIVDKKTGEKEVFHCVTVTGEAPQYNGWTFIATLEHTEGGNIIRSVPGHEVPVSFREVDNYCDHCKSRRRRKETFVIHHEDGTYKQIGRTCIADFLGHTDPEKYARWFDMLGEAWEDAAASCSAGGGFERYYDIETYMSYVVECITKFGWVSGTYAREQMEYYDRYIEATAWRAIRNLLPPKTKEDEKRRDFDFPSDESIEKAKVIIEWGKALKTRSDNNDYKHNLSVIANCGYVTYNKMGFAASMANAYEMELKNIEYKARIAKEKEEVKKSEYVGEVGKRQEFTVTVERVILFENQFGTTKFHIMKDDSGNRLVWYSSNQALEENTTYTLKATVKDHNFYDNVKQTVLTRCAVV